MNRSSGSDSAYPRNSVAASSALWRVLQVALLICLLWGSVYWAVQLP